VADEFRRNVITKDGKVHNGSILIERLPAEGAEAPAPAPAAPIATGFVGVFVHEADAPAATPAPTSAPAAAPHPAKAGHGKLHKKRR
jgi:hypothetical protein